MRGNVQHERKTHKSFVFPRKGPALISKRSIRPSQQVAAGHDSVCIFQLLIVARQAARADGELPAARTMQRLENPAASSSASTPARNSTAGRCRGRMLSHANRFVAVGADTSDVVNATKKISKNSKNRFCNKSLFTILCVCEEHGKGESRVRGEKPHRGTIKIACKNDLSRHARSVPSRLSTNISRLLPCSRVRTGGAVDACAA